MGVKASGGVRTCEDAEKMRSAGASRIGASASVAIVTGCQNKAASSGSGAGEGPKKGVPARPGTQRSSGPGNY